MGRIGGAVKVIDEEPKELLQDARTELEDAIEDAFLAAMLYAAAGDTAMSQSVAAHATALQVLLVRRIS